MISFDSLLSDTFAPSELIRLPGIGRLLGVSLWRRTELRAWLEEHGAHEIDPTFAGPLHERPSAHCWRLGEVAAVVRRNKNRLPEFITSRRAHGP